MNLKIKKITSSSDLVFLLTIFLISFVLRIIAIDIPLNTDEPLWLARGFHFLEAFFSGDWKATYQKHHPGVINMWLIGLSQYLNLWLAKISPDWLASRLEYSYQCLENIPSFCPINAYIVPRFIQAIITSACMGGIYWFSKQLFGQWQAILATLLLIFSPFFLAYQRFITTDALQADFSILAVLSFFLYLRQNQKVKLLIISGIFMGLAILAKITSLFIIPPIIVILILRELNIWQNTFPSQGWLRMLRNLSLWGFILILTIFLSWPILWNNPAEVWQSLNTHLPVEVTRGGIYFLGKITNKPNALFYPLVLVYRLSPLVQIGLLAWVISLVIPRLRKQQIYLNELMAMAIIALLPLIFLSMFDSKLDRYVLIVYPELTLLAAGGWLEISNWLKPLRQKIKLKNKKSNYLVISVVTISFVLLIAYYPYYISYYNPFFGGGKMAEKIFIVGNGEGLEQAAKWLNQKQNAEQLIVNSWYDTAFASYFQGKTTNSWKEANFIVLYINQIQRNYIPAKIQEYLKNKQPLHVVKLDDLEYAKVYQGPI